MILTPFETSLYRQLARFFGDYEFALLPEKKQFRRITPTGFQNVILSPSYYGDTTLLDVNFGCRNEQVEQIAQQFLPTLTDFRADANTLLISIGKYQQVTPPRYSIRSDFELESVCRQIMEFFTNGGFQQLNDTCSLRSLDRILNDDPAHPCPYVYNQTFRCYKGLTVASLTHNPHFLGLIDLYRHQLDRQSPNAYEQINFDRLVSYLQHYSAN
ncbi:hypothetical protein FAES_1958 [Fibrella aestuarina BUZ 2]|uniref:Uncharacterized protein n=1 Tax=Fibrella aestuarina BUZ 2 TaxID=1166018 RepID=I0K764_9BACT|nr:hypothetical protein [Fibrella aestuarina]CCG99967.1 hypothetical protein FAES_1958 [Fibrella aestuarina BUZ 2]